MSRAIVLMYHALYADPAELEAIDPADQPYAVSVEDFGRQLDWLAREGIPVCDPAAIAGAEPCPPLCVALTFDDGHASNYWHAFPMLRERGLRGVFFVTTDFIGTRRGFCEWRQLREMSAAGMHIGSHGKTHRFFDDLSSGGVEEEYSVSRDEILSGTGRAPSMISFPGGRYRHTQINAGTAAGYALFFTSDVGANSPGDFIKGGMVRRIAIGRGTSHAAFQRIAGGNRIMLARAVAKGVAKKAVRRILGNRLYHALYERLSVRG